MALSTIKNNTTHIQDLMSEIGVNAKQAAKTIRTADTETKNKALLSAADFLEQDYKIILEANKIDVDNAKSKNLSASMIDRLILNEDKIKAIANALREIAALPDPVGRQLSQWERPNGLNITRISTPLGVIGIIYESRPNVTADAGALAMKSGNCSILRGGSESQLSSKAIHKCLIKGLEFANLPAEIIQLVPTTDREAVGMMLGGMTDCIDMIIPRGGKSLVERIQKEAKVPVLAHLEGICHTYIHADADEKMATDIAVNAKMRRTGVCGATETILIDKALDSQKIINILHALDQVGCTIRGCQKTVNFYSKVTLATEEDWRTEYLAPIVSVKIVDDFMHAINHIQTYSSGHTEAIITENNDLAEKFLLHIDSAITMHNASTQFADGGEFGMGAEIGIATGKIHARGPVGLEQLTCFKYQVRGNGQIRPL